MSLPAALILDRVTLRRFSRRDGPALCRLLSLEQPPPFEPDQMEAECLHLALVREKDPCFWAACLGGEQGRFLGQLALSPLEGWPEGFWELGYAFLPEYQGQGYAWESCRGLLDHAFGSLGARGIAAFCDPENSRSIRLLERLGMESQGLRENLYCRAEGRGALRWRGALVYQLKAADYGRGRT